MKGVVIYYALHEALSTYIIKDRIKHRISGRWLFVNFYMRRVKDQLDTAVYSKMKIGSKPFVLVLNSDRVIYRVSIYKEIVNLYFPNPKNTGSEGNAPSYGIIVSPFGIRKSILVM